MNNITNYYWYISIYTSPKWESESLLWSDKVKYNGQLYQILIVWKDINEIIKYYNKSLWDLYSYCKCAKDINHEWWYTIKITEILGKYPIAKDILKQHNIKSWLDLILSNPKKIEKILWLSLAGKMINKKFWDGSITIHDLIQLCKPLEFNLREELRKYLKWIINDKFDKLNDNNTQRSTEDIQQIVILLRLNQKSKNEYQRIADLRKNNYENHKEILIEKLKRHNINNSLKLLFFWVEKFENEIGREEAWTILWKTLYWWVTREDLRDLSKKLGRDLTQDIKEFLAQDQYKITDMKSLIDYGHTNFLDNIWWRIVWIATDQKDKYYRGDIINFWESLWRSLQKLIIDLLHDGEIKTSQDISLSWTNRFVKIKKYIGIALNKSINNMWTTDKDGLIKYLWR